MMDHQRHITRIARSPTRTVPEIFLGYTPPVILLRDTYWPKRGSSITPITPRAESFVRSLASPQVGVWLQDLAAMKKTESRLEEASRSADIAGGRSAFSSPSSPSTSREGGESSGRPATERGSGQHAVAEAATSEGVTGADSKPGEAEVGAVAASPSATVDDRHGGRPPARSNSDGGSGNGSDSPGLRESL